MTEYIEREAVKEAIGFVHLHCVRYGENKSLLDVINEIPAANVAPVVRCKDCCHSYDGIGGLVCSYGPCVDCIVPEDFYCKHGERKNENDK